MRVRKEDYSVMKRDAGTRAAEWYWSSSDGGIVRKGF